MTKFNSFKKIERKQLKKQKKDKIYFYETEDIDENVDISKVSKTRIPSRQQYKRIKNKHFVQNFTAQSSIDYKLIKKLNKTKVFKEQVNGTILLLKQESCDHHIVTPRLSDVSDDICTSRPSSSLSFHIQPDWSDFEDTENVQFVSELDVDLSKVFKLFDHKETAEIEVLDDLCLPWDMPENNLSSWAEDLSTHRYDHALSTICFIEDIIRSNYSNIFTDDFKATMWLHCLGDANMLLVFCESNKCLFQDLMTKEYSISMQNNCLKWTELGTKCSSMKSSLEIIVNFNEGKHSLNTTLCVLYEQCISMMDHGLVYPDPLVVRIIEGIKIILSNLKSQYNKIQIVLEDLLDLSDKCCMSTLEKITREIIILEERKPSNNQLKSVVKSIGIYLGKEATTIKESNHYVEGSVKSFCGIKGNHNNIPFETFHLKLIFVFLMSMIILFGGPEMDVTTFMKEYSTNNSMYVDESVVLNHSAMNT